MKNLNKIVRENILALAPYSSARDEFTGTEGVFLDANENPYGNLNRYPDPYQRELKSHIAGLKSVSEENIFIGNGSDEAIDLAYRIFCEPKQDKAVAFTPSYGMYEVSANINDVELIKIALTDEFQIDTSTLSLFLEPTEYKLLFICSPNNPSGNVIDKKVITTILEEFNGIVVVDEAYADFSTFSCLELLPSFPNLVVLQTFSKARGLAAARVGMAFASAEIIELFNKVKPPYNVSLLNQQAAINALKDELSYTRNLNAILKERDLLNEALSKIEFVRKVYPSDANFLLVEMDFSQRVYEYLLAKKIIIRSRTQIIKNCLRLTVGTAAENQLLIQALQTFNP